MHIISDPFLQVCPSCTRRKHYCNKRLCQTCCHFSLHFAHIGFEHEALSDEDALVRVRSIIATALSIAEQKYGVPERFSLSALFISQLNPATESFISRAYDATRETVLNALTEDMCARPAGKTWSQNLFEGMTGFILRIRQGKYAERCDCSMYSQAYVNRWVTLRERMMDLREDIEVGGLSETFRVPPNHFTSSPLYRFTHDGYTILFSGTEDKKRHS